MIVARPSASGHITPPFLLAVFWLAFLALSFLPDRAGALEPQRREVIAVNARVWDGYGYEETLVPSTKEEMTLIAGQDSAIVFVRTLEYYWPLSRQAYVDFERQRDVIAGELVVRRNGEVITRAALQPYAISYPEGAVNGNGRLIWGQEAERAYAEYQENEHRFARAFSAAQRAHSDYERRLIESGAARLQGEPIETIEPPPPLPKPSLKLVTAPSAGFRVRLEPGVYSMAIEDAGHPVPGTRRMLRVVGLSGRTTLVADIVPEERWTRPLATNIEAARIFARPGTVFYLTLAEATRFDEAEYLSVVKPQAEPVAGRAMWVRRRPADLDQLQFMWNGAETKRLFRQSLKVEQTQGSSFGYRVRPTRNGEKSDLNAFTVLVPSELSFTRGYITLDGQAQTPFDREVVVVHPRGVALGLALAFLPLAGYFVVRGWWRITADLI